VDGKLAPALEGALQRFAKPWYRMRALRVFRDDASLSTNPALWSSITAALDESAFFILLCSPEAAKSPWVQKEVEYWSEYKPHDRLLLALTEGTLEWDPEKHGFDDSEQSAAPPTLQSVFEEEPRYTDLTWARQADRLSLEDPRFRDDVADLGAALHGRPKDELIGEAVRQHRRTVRIALSAALLLALLAAAAVVAAVFAVQQRDEARAERDLATSRYLAAQARSEFSSNLPRALLLSLEALEISDTAEARGSLYAGLQLASPELVSFLADDLPSSGAVAFDAHGDTVATASGSVLTVWDVGEQRRRGPPLDTGTAILSAALSPDGNTAAIGDAGGAITLWNVADRRQLGSPLQAHAAEVVDLVFSPDGATLASGGLDFSIGLWDVERRARIGAPAQGAFFPHANLAFTSDNRVVASVSSVAPILLVDFDGGRAQRLAPEQTGTLFMRLASDPERGVVAAGSNDGTITLWDVERREQVGKPLRGHRGSVVAAAFSPDGKLLASADELGAVLLWDVERHRRLGPLRGHADAVVGLAFAEDGHTLVSGGEHEVVLWDVDRRSTAGPLRGHLEFVNSLSFSPDDRTLASAANEIVFWDVEEHRQLGEPVEELGAYTSIAFQDGSTIASGDAFGQVIVWDVENRRQLNMLPGGHDFNNVWALAVGPDGRPLVSGAEDDRIIVWDTERREAVGDPLQGHEADVMAATVSPDGGMLASGDANGTIILWDLETREQVGSLPQRHEGSVLGLAFAPDGTTLASGAEGEIIVWDVERREQLGTPLADRRGQEIRSLAVSPDATKAALGFFDGTIALWDLSRRQQIGTPFKAHSRLVSALAFSHDSTTLASASTDGTVRLWDVDLASWARRACEVANRNLTAAEWSQFIGAGRDYRRTCENLPAGEGAEAASG
jgi:WD40 repeat protein